MRVIFTEASVVGTVLRSSAISIDQWSLGLRPKRLRGKVVVKIKCRSPLSDTVLGARWIEAEPKKNHRRELGCYSRIQVTLP